MPRPRNKTELLTASTERYVQLNALIDALKRSELYADFPFEHRDRNIRDVLSHLHEWHLMMISWYESGMAGGKPEMPAKGYTWKTTPELNEVIRAKYQRASLKNIRRRFNDSHAALLKVISGHTDDELFTKRLYSWTGTTSLGSYFTSALSSHYDWATKLLRRFIRSLQKTRS